MLVSVALTLLTTFITADAVDGARATAGSRASHDADAGAGGEAPPSRPRDAGPQPATAIDPAIERATDQLDKTLSLKTGPADVDVVVATVHVPEGVVFADANGAKAWEQATHNAASGKEVALFGLKSGARVLVEFADVGFVNDDDAAELEPQRDTLLKRVQSAAKAPVVVDGWLRAPAYDAKAHDVSWCVSVKSDAGAGFDCAHRIVARRGFLAVSLLGDAKVSRENAESELNGMLSNMSWKQGEAYGSARKDGDVDAGFGLSALVSSGQPIPIARNKLVIAPRARILVAAAVGAIIAAVAGARGVRKKRRGVG